MKPKNDNKKPFAFKNWQIALLVTVVLVTIFLFGILWQSYAEADAYILSEPHPGSSKELYEIYKLKAEIRQIRSDTTGNLFWLKLVALFVTVGGAVGGYLIAQSKASRDKLSFHHRKDIDAAYQQIVQELSAQQDILRASAAVKLGSILNQFPTEWQVEDGRQKELILLTKQILAAALAIEQNPKVLKTVTIALIRDETKKELNGKLVDYGIAVDLDLSYANATDAYWAKTDFTYTDFYRANMERASFRQSTIKYAQFRESNLKHVVFTNADCTGANFKLADLRNANFDSADLTNANFDRAKVYECKLTANTKLSNAPDIMVDLSDAGDGSIMKPFDTWYTAQKIAP